MAYTDDIDIYITTIHKAHSTQQFTCRQHFSLFQFVTHRNPNGYDRCGADVKENNTKMTMTPSKQHKKNNHPHL